jgi:hypothetical protein
MKRSRAIEHLVEMAAEASDMARLSGAALASPLREMWATATSSPTWPPSIPRPW